MSGYDTSAPLELKFAEKLRADLMVATENVQRLREAKESISTQYHEAVDRRREINDQLLSVGYLE